MATDDVVMCRIMYVWMTIERDSIQDQMLDFHEVDPIAQIRVILSEME